MSAPLPVVAPQGAASDSPAPPSGGVAHVKIARKFFSEDPFWAEERTFSKAEAWIDLIQMAAWTELRRRNSAGHIEVIQRGEFTASVRYLGKAWGWPKSNTQRFLAQLVEIGHIRVGRELVQQLGRPVGQLVGQKQSVYVIEKYDTYQGTPRNRGTPSGTTSRTASETRTGTNNKAVKALKHKSSSNHMAPTAKPSPSDFAIPADAGVSVTDEEWASWMADADTMAPDLDVVGHIGYEELVGREACAEFETAEGGMITLPLGGPVEPSVPVGAPIPAKMDKRGRPEYPEAFERFWTAYPKRANGNPKKGALRCWKANLLRGATAEAMQTAVETYALYCRGQLVDKRVIECTGWVKQGTTFLGPDEPWKQWVDRALVSPAPAPDGPAEEVVDLWADILATARF